MGRTCRHCKKPHLTDNGALMHLQYKHPAEFRAMMAEHFTEGR